MTNQEPGTHAVDGRLLTINTGSSSLKAALYEMGEAETRLLRKLTAHVEVSCEVFAEDFKLAFGVFLKPRPRFPGISFCDHHPPTSHAQ